MTKQQISEEAKQEVLRLLVERATKYEGIDIKNAAVLAVNLSIFQEENENLKNQIEDARSEIEILTGDLRATACALEETI
jgi:hypothetical protein